MKKRVATIDFETRSRQDIRSVGSYRYATDPTTSAVCLAYEIDGGPTELWVPGVSDDPEELFEHIRAGGIVEGHNVGFERSMWTEYLIPNFGFPSVPFENWDCTSARSSAIGLPPSLGELGKVLDLDKKKDDVGHSVMLKVCRPKFPYQNDPEYFNYPIDELVWNTDLGDLSTTYTYCRDDVRSERELSSVVPVLSEFERKVWLIDQKANSRGVTINKKAVDIIIEKINELERDNLPRFAEITDGAVHTPGQFQKIKEWVNSRGVKLPNTQAETIADFLDRDEDKNNRFRLPKDVRELLELRVMFGGSAVKKYKKMLACMGPDGRVRDTLVYAGAARTTRWSGRRVQPQNLFRSMTSNVDLLKASFDALYAKDWYILELIYGSLMKAFASLTRSVLIPEPGSEFFVADFSSVETGFLFWIANDKEALQGIRAGKKIYETTAAQVFGVRYEDVTPEQRQFGKKLVLGLGYGMGATKFVRECRDEGIKLDEEFIRNAVAMYREIHKPVVKLWRGTDRAFKKVIATGSPVRFAGGKLRARIEERGTPQERLVLDLPSGRSLYYWNPKLVSKRKKFEKFKKVRDSKTGKIKTVPDGFESKIIKEIRVSGIDKRGKFIRIGTYGSKIVENFVQAGCRDLMAFSMITVDAEGYNILWTAHDEIISEVKRGLKKLKDYCRLMSIPPGWYDGPINADGWSGLFYRK